MIKVKIIELEDDFQFITEMPVIPQREDKIAAYFNDEWCICEVYSIIHEFESDGEFSLIEIGVIAK